MAAAMCRHPVKLGFIEEDTDLSLLKSQFFPSKIGGKPSWLSLEPVLGGEDLKCQKCSDPCIFLMQVYAPLAMRDDTFHRTIFVFVCSNASCSSQGDNSNFRVFRSQLPLINNFYSKDPPPESIDEGTDVDSFPSADKFQTLCHVCGCKGTKKCSQCRKLHYCCKAHQVIDWKAGHKKLCQCAENGSTDEPGANYSAGILFKEFELVTEDEHVSEADCNNSKSEEECLQEFEQMKMLAETEEVEDSFATADLEQSAAAETEDDKQFQKFKRRIDPEPMQVLRYDRGGEPLWVSAFHKATKENVPNCSCGAARIFEFQVMPQLLNYLNVDHLDASLDWGTLCIYTCQESCNPGNLYLEEFLWKQDFQNPGH
ncbi:unnamed protein product [Candidula unifasciata]|uniref:MYND-type domain-containing protein n=1 Tax=Candidula unifasciata TaxID=100452 RepID=A0A8S3YLY1_9EUPU|nr:unnamed protein product [Candidula unifasciata]